jgi:RHS repeat-associated protein
VQELSGTTPTANLLTGGLDEYFTRTDSNGTANFLTDALGSTAVLTDSTGIAQTQYSFDPFGSTTQSGNSSTNSLAYTGRENDGTGLYYYRARYYSPTLHRFESEDPIGFNGGATNLYLYSGDSPTNLRDPSGKDAVSDNVSWSWDFAKSFVGDFSISGRKQKELNRCAGELSQSALTLNPSPGNFFADALLGNQFGTIAQAALGPDQGNAIGQLVVDNPIPKASLNQLIQAGIAAIPTGGTVYVANGNVVLGPWGPALDTSPTAVTIGNTALGEGLFGAAELFEAGKAVLDAGVYVGALYVCAEQ